MKHIKFILVMIVFTTSGISCKKQEPLLPMPKEKLIQLMQDIYVAESMAAHADLEVRDSVHALYLEQVAKNHRLTTNDIRNILKKLSEMPDSLYMIQGLAIDSLNARQSRIQEVDRLRHN